jgi:hypothetical protein
MVSKKAASVLSVSLLTGALLALPALAVEKKPGGPTQASAVTSPPITSIVANHLDVSYLGVHRVLPGPAPPPSGPGGPLFFSGWKLAVRFKVKNVGAQASTAGNAFLVKCDAAGGGACQNVAGGLVKRNIPALPPGGEFFSEEANPVTWPVGKYTLTSNGTPTKTTSAFTVK